MSIERRESSRGLRYDVRYRAPNGTERSRTFRTRKEARAFEVEQQAQLTRGAWIDPRAAATKFAAVAEQ